MSLIHNWKRIVIQIVLIIAARGRIDRGNTKGVPVQSAAINEVTAGLQRRRNGIAIVMRDRRLVRIAPEDLVRPDRSVYLSLLDSMSKRPWTVRLLIDNTFLMI